MRLSAILTLILAGMLTSCSEMRPDDAAGDDAARAAPAGESDKTEGVFSMTDKVIKTDEEWRAMLTDEQYRITRLKGTERALTGAYWNTRTRGTYTCTCCGEALFSSETKYDSGCGWPSFWAPIDEQRVATETDDSLGMVRTEILCDRCGAHLGHVFKDGPNPTGLRYCVNSASLKLVEDD
jgi:peptide-methionine (R)-S-oxide reductase